MLSVFTGLLPPKYPTGSLIQCLLPSMSANTPVHPRHASSATPAPYRAPAASSKTVLRRSSRPFPPRMRSIFLHIPTFYIKSHIPYIPCHPVINAGQSGILDRQSGLLIDFSDHRFFESLTRLHMPSGKCRSRIPFPTLSSASTLPSLS